MDNRCETHLDVGAGREAEYVLKLARKNLCNRYLVIEPEIRERPKDWPPNLQLVSPNSATPYSIHVATGSVDKVSLNFLCGELRETESQSESENWKLFAPRSYFQLLQEVKRVLKFGGVLEITEPSSNIYIVERTIRAAGFQITKEPVEVQDRDKTGWTKRFFDLQQRIDRHYETKDLIPMELEAVR